MSVLTSDCRKGDGMTLKSVLRSCSMKSMTMKTLATVDEEPVHGSIDETHWVNVSPTTTSRIPTTFSCLQTVKALISRSAVIGNPCFSSSSLSFFKATISPVSFSRARKTTP